MRMVAICRKGAKEVWKGEGGRGLVLMYILCKKKGKLKYCTEKEIIGRDGLNYKEGGEAGGKRRGFKRNENYLGPPYLSFYAPIPPKRRFLSLGTNIQGSCSFRCLSSVPTFVSAPSLCCSVPVLLRPCVAPSLPPSSPPSFLLSFCI